MIIPEVRFLYYVHLSRKKDIRVAFFDDKRVWDLYIKFCLDDKRKSSHINEIEKRIIKSLLGKKKIIKSFLNEKRY